MLIYISMLINKTSDILDKRQVVDSIFIECINERGLSLNMIVDPTPEVCMAAVKQNGCEIKYIENQTPELCMEAVKQNSRAIQYIKNRTPELCMEAVKRSGFVIKYIEEQTPELCMEAVKQDAYAIIYVKDQTPEILIEAIKQNFKIIYSIDASKRTLEVCRLAYQMGGIEVLKYIDFNKVKIEDIIEKIQTKYVEIDIVNKIIFKDAKTKIYKYINKNINTYDTILKHITIMFAGIELNDIKYIYSQEKDHIDEIIKQQKDDKEQYKMLLIRKANIYKLYDKTINISTSEWISSFITLYNNQKLINFVKVGKYIDPDISDIVTL